MTSRLDAYNQTIQPLMDQLADACKKAGASLVCSVVVPDDNGEADFFTKPIPLPNSKMPNEQIDALYALGYFND